MSAAPADAAPRSFWERTTLGWHLAFAAVTALVAVTGAVGATGVDRVVIPLLVGVVVVAYVGFGRRALGADRLPLALGYLVPAWLALLAIVLRDDSGYLLLFILFPQSWAMLPTRRAAVTWNCLTVAALVAVQVQQGEVASALLVGGINLALTLLLGLWISGIVEESQRRAELIAELQRTRAELAETERARGVLAERERLARDIHDTLAQGFTSVLTLAQAAEAAIGRDPEAVRQRLDLLTRTARDNLAEARALVSALGPVDLDGSTLGNALRRLAARFAEETGLNVTATVAGTLPSLPAGTEVVVVRAAQEALTKVRRHAGASTVRLQLVPRGNGVELVVSDDGAGMPAAATDGFGLAGMRARAREVGGEVDVSSRPGAGPPCGSTSRSVPAVTVRVIVVDDHPVVRTGLVGMLEAATDITVVGEAGDGVAAVQACLDLRPDVVLMDLRMPQLDGASATERITAVQPDVRVLVLTTYDTDADIVRAVEAGASGYLLKDAPRESLTEAVRAAARGETVLAPPVAARLVSRIRDPQGRSHTPRELEVLRLVARGLSNADIGRQLHIAEATVKTHLLRVFAKLDVDDRTRAVTIAYERGLLAMPGR